MEYAQYQKTQSEYNDAINALNEDLRKVKTFNYLDIGKNRIV